MSPSPRLSGSATLSHAAFDGWSQKSDKYDAVETRKRWNHYFRSPPDRIGVGTLDFEASKADPRWRDAYDACHAWGRDLGETPLTCSFGPALVEE